MPIKRRSRGECEINMGPFADIAFLMIVFFVLATSLIRPMGQLLQIPATAAATQQTKSQTLTVDIRPDGLLFGRGETNLEPVGIELLREKLIALNLPQQPEQQRMVVVNLADGVKFERFYQVITAVSRAGGIVTLIEEEAKGAVP